MRVVCNIPEGTTASEFDPFPASEKAIKLGCTCPHQEGWPKWLEFDLDCPVHQLEKVPH
jgi:hypothetical protein